MSRTDGESRNDAFWRGSAPLARRVAAFLYAWLGFRSAISLALLAAAPFLIASLVAPALLSDAPPAEMLAPVGAARALAAGAADLSTMPAPFYALLLLAADGLADAPGRAHLLAKAFAAGFIALAFAWLSAARFPALAAAVMTAALAGLVAAPGTGAAEIGFAFFVASAIAFLAAPADESGGRARGEGAVGGLCLAAAWMSAPAPALAGFVALSAAPFLTGRAGAQRYATGLAVLAVVLGLAELAAPGVAIQRARAVTAGFSGGGMPSAAEAAGFSGAGMVSAIVIFAAAVFGGRAHAKGWAAAAIFTPAAVLAAHAAGTDPAPAYMAGAALAAFSTASPFYDGIFRAHDRASVALAAAVAGLTLVLTGGLAREAGARLLAQHEAAAAAPAELRDALGLVHSGAPRAARWIEEGRFSASEAREALALAPADQAAILLAAAQEARIYARYGVDVAILTGADTACLLAARRTCAADGAAAARAAAVTLVPRLDLDPLTAAVKARSEAVLYTDFRLVETTPLWDVWVRRGANLPAALAARAENPDRD